GGGGATVLDLDADGGGVGQRHDVQLALIQAQVALDDLPAAGAQVLGGEVLPRTAERGGAHLPHPAGRGRGDRTGRGRIRGGAGDGSGGGSGDGSAGGSGALREAVHAASVTGFTAYRLRRCACGDQGALWTTGAPATEVRAGRCPAC